MTDIEIALTGKQVGRYGQEEGWCIGEEPGKRRICDHQHAPRRQAGQMRANLAHGHPVGIDRGTLGINRQPVADLHLLIGALIAVARVINEQVVIGA